MQGELYEHLFADFVLALEKHVSPDGAPSDVCKECVFEFLEKVRLLCAHPACLPPAQLPCIQGCEEPDRTKPEQSGKLTGLMELLSRIFESGSNEKILVFATRKVILALLQHCIEARFEGVEVLQYTGEIAMAERPAVENRFRNDPQCRVLLLTLGAGGTGLNFTCASHVVHFDRCYNPAKERQATDRAHRLGQDKTVCVHTFVTRNTFEERLDAIVRSRRELGAGMDSEFSVEGRWLADYGNRDLLELFRLKAT